MFGSANNIEILDHKIIETELAPPYKKYKKELDLKLNGTILCFKAKVPKSNEMIGEKSFQVYLFNEANDFSEKCKNFLYMLNIHHICSALVQIFD